MEQEVMQAIRAELESNIDAKYREFHSSLVPGQNCRILGVRIPVSRRIAKATARDHYEVYTEQFNPGSLRGASDPRNDDRLRKADP